MCKFQIDSCEPADYVRPRVAIAQLPGAAASMSAGLGAVQPGGNTPIAPAVDGAADHLRTHLAAVTGPRAGALVMASDVAPTACGNSAEPGVIQAIMTRATARPRCPPTSSGPSAPATPSAPRSRASSPPAGGTGMPFLLGNTTADLGDRFLEALAAIRGSALPCQFRIAMPSAGHHRLRQGERPLQRRRRVRTTCVYVGSADKCDPMRGGWYYDVDPAQGKPSTVHVCPATCARFKSEMGGAVELRFGCRTRID